MIVVRAIAEHDFEGFKRLAYASHINFYSLPKNDKLLQHIFEKSLASFASTKGKYYLFVAENMETGELLGVSALSAISGGNEPLFFFKKGYSNNQPILTAVTYPEGPSEVCSLFVDKSARGTGVGKLLSLGRFLFAAKFPERFTDSFISELRGPLENGTSPFWELVGRKFFDQDFAKVQQMMSFGRSFIQDFLPKYPLYVNLLPQKAQDAIGKIDKDTEGAFSLLGRLGFTVTDEIDVIDAGPKLSAKAADITVIKNSKVIKEKKFAKPCIISNDRLDFRAILSDEVSDALRADALVRIYEL